MPEGESPLDREAVFGERDGEIERIAPGFFPTMALLEAMHVARYEWARRWAAGSVVLDVACGTGYGAPILWKAGASRVVSVDIAEPALVFGRDQYGILAVRSDAMRLPLAARSFDTIVSFETIEHLPDPLAFLDELRRLLRPAGVLAISTPNADLSEGHNPYHVEEWTLPELLGHLRDSGFRPSVVRGQRWRIRRGGRRVRSLRELTARIEASPRVRHVPSAEPHFWCVCCT